MLVWVKNYSGQINTRTKEGSDSKTDIERGRLGHKNDLEIVELDNEKTVFVTISMGMHYYPTFGY